MNRTTEQNQALDFEDAKGADMSNVPELLAEVSRLALEAITNSADGGSVAMWLLHMARQLADDMVIELKHPEITLGHLTDFTDELHALLVGVLSVPDATEASAPSVTAALERIPLLHASFGTATWEA
jgi:hypothetical protein